MKYSILIQICRAHGSRTINALDSSPAPKHILKVSDFLGLKQSKVLKYGGSRELSVLFSGNSLKCCHHPFPKPDHGAGIVIPCQCNFHILKYFLHLGFFSFTQSPPPVSLTHRGLATWKYWKDYNFMVISLLTQETPIKIACTSPIRDVLNNRNKPKCYPEFTYHLSLRGNPGNFVFYRKPEFTHSIKK